MEPSLKEILTALQQASAAMPEDRAVRMRCPVCISVRASVIRGIKSHFVEFINDPESRVKLRAAGGYCPQHAELLPSTGDALGAAILYADLTDQAIEKLQNTPQRSGLLRRVASQKKLQQCPACLQQSEAEARYALALAAGLNNAEVWQELEAGAGLCTTHLELTLQAAPAETAAKLKQLELQKLQALKVELEEAVRKHDYRFKHEEWGPEKDAWLRAPGKITRPK